MVIKKNMRLCALLSLLALCANLQASSRPSTPPPAPQATPSASNSPTSFNAFLFTVATGVTVILIGKGCDYLMSKASGNDDLRQQELKLQKERVAQHHMALIFEFCKDETYKDTCQQLKRQYLESQMALNSARNNA